MLDRRLQLSESEAKKKTNKKHLIKFETCFRKTLTHIQTKAFLLTLKALCADKPLSRGGFLRIKLVARFRVGVATTACCCIFCLSKEAVVVLLSAIVVAREVVEEIAAVVGEMP